MRFGGMYGTLICLNPSSARGTKILSPAPARQGAVQTQLAQTAAWVARDKSTVGAVGCLLRVAWLPTMTISSSVVSPQPYRTNGTRLILAAFLATRSMGPLAYAVPPWPKVPVGEVPSP